MTKIHFFQDCHPVRLKGVHVLNTASFMDKVLTLIKPLMQSELVKLVNYFIFFGLICNIRYFGEMCTL